MLKCRCACENSNLADGIVRRAPGPSPSCPSPTPPPLVLCQAPAPSSTPLLPPTPPQAARQQHKQWLSLHLPALHPSMLIETSALALPVLRYLHVTSIFPPGARCDPLHGDHSILGGGPEAACETVSRRETKRGGRKDGGASVGKVERRLSGQGKTPPICCSSPSLAAPGRPPAFLLSSRCKEKQLHPPQKIKKQQALGVGSLIPIFPIFPHTCLPPSVPLRASARLLRLC